MPLIEPSTYRPPPIMRNGHVQTVWPVLTRRVDNVGYERERIKTPDGDFLDLDWSRTDASRLAILTHGLEGNSRRLYMLGMAAALNARGWDVLAWNLRGCSGEPNTAFRLYHSGATDDLDTVLQHATMGTRRYDSLALVGFSLGGNMTLKYLGEREVDPRFRAAVAISVPCHLESGAHKMGQRVNRPYMRVFLRSLHRKIRAKMLQFPGRIDDSGYDRIRTFHEFDDRFTAPLNGFADASDYYRQSSSVGYLAGIRIPTLLINARNDPFLSSRCFPTAEAEASASFCLEAPDSGGHAGFPPWKPGCPTWLETRTAGFLEEQL